MIWWLATFAVLTLLFRGLFGALAAAERHYIRHSIDFLPPPLPTTVGDFLTWPGPLCADGVEVTEGGGPCLVLNQAAAKLRCRDVQVPA